MTNQTKNRLPTLKFDILKSPDYPANSSERRGSTLITWPIFIVRALTTMKVSVETPGYKNETPWRMINVSFKVYEVKYQGLARWGPASHMLTAYSTIEGKIKSKLYHMNVTYLS